MPNRENWKHKREVDAKYETRDPEVGWYLVAVAFDNRNQVLIIGGGHSGLEVAARLKHLGVSHLVVEKNARIGDNWRNRYNSLTLHDPICAYIRSRSIFLCSLTAGVNHMPYLTYDIAFKIMRLLLML